MEIVEMIIIGGYSAVVSGFFTVFWRYLLDFRRDRRISVLESEIDRLDMTIKSFQGVAVRQANKEEEAAFMLQAQAILTGEGEMMQKVQKIISLNPALAMKLAAKMGLKL